MALGNTSNSLGKDFWKEISCNSSSAVKVVYEKLHLCIPPYYLSDLGKSVASVIDCRLIRYEPDLGGILAGYGNLAIRESKAQTLFNLSDIHVDVVGNFYIFNPEVNQELVGIVNRISVDHIGCLVHGLFNISLPKPFNITSENWLGKPAKLLDKVKFGITKVDLYSIVPYIEGKIVELIPQAEHIPESRERTSSDSGVEFTSEESIDIVVTPGKSMEHKRSKLSLSQRKNEAKLSLTAKLDSGPTQSMANEVIDEVSEQKKKRKRQISGDTAMKETPKKKKAKLFGSQEMEDTEEVVSVETLTNHLFEKFSKQLEFSPSSPRKKKKTLDISRPAITSVIAESDVAISEEGENLIGKEVQQRKNSPKKKIRKEISEGIEKHARSPEKSVSQQDFEIECEMKCDSNEEEKMFVKTTRSEKKTKLRLEKKNEGSKFAEIKTPETQVEQLASLKKSKDSNKVNGILAPSEPSKRKNELLKQGDAEEDITVKTPKSEKKLKSCMEEKNEDGSKFTEIKTPEKLMKQATSIKKSKNSNKVNVKALQQEHTEEDSESIIQELLGLSLPIASPQSTPLLSKKNTSSIKSSKFTVSTKKLSASERTLNSSPKLMQVQDPETASPLKKQKKNSLSMKSLKALALEGKERASPIEEAANVSSPLTSKAYGSSKKLIKSASPEKIVNVSLLEKKIKVEQLKKRSKSRLEKDKFISRAGSDNEFDQEEAVLKILQSVQPKENSAKTKTKRKSTNS